MASYSTAILVCCLLATQVSSGTAGSDSAWNGHVSPGSATPTVFTPYYVPPGAKSYDSASPLIHYSGKWTESFSPAYVQKSIHRTRARNASVSFTFFGTGIEWFGNMDKTHGVSDVYIDGLLVESVDTWSVVAMTQQRVFWKFDLSFGKHVIKIINTSQRKGSRHPTRLDLDTFVVTKGVDPSLLTAQDQHTSPTMSNPSSDPPILLSLAQVSSTSSSQWTLTEKGTTGVHAMQLAIISDTHALIVDKVEHNPLTINGHPAWGALYNLKTHAVKPLSMKSNSFCAGGTFLGNGTMINVGGNPVVDNYTSAADFGDLDGLQAIRIFEPCDSDSVNDCDIYENHSRIRMASPRWYNTVVRISDGSAIIIGGSKKGGWINNATVNNPTIEYFPPKSIHGSNGMPIQMPFLTDTLASNLFPIAIALPDGKIFIAANRDAMIYDWVANTERRLPQIPNGVRVTYPMTGTGLLLPLSPDNNYTPEVLLCGGSTVDDTKPGYEISSQDSASAQCSRMVLTDEGINAGWQVEEMPQARVMPDAVILPTGDILVVNGARSGISGYANVRDQIGASNADNPVFTPVLYKPNSTAGQRFSSDGIPTSKIPRLYHSVATLTPNGDVMVAGSNPNLDRSEVKYGTEYRVEWLGPGYMSMKRPEIVDKTIRMVGFGECVKLKVKIPQSVTIRDKVKVALMDLGYVTHAVHANSRLVYLAASLAGDHTTLSVIGPPNGNVYPPGPGWLYVVADGVPSIGIKIMIGDGQAPVVDKAALNNVLEKTVVDQYERAKGEKSTGEESE